MTRIIVLEHNCGLEMQTSQVECSQGTATTSSNRNNTTKDRNQKCGNIWTKKVIKSNPQKGMEWLTEVLKMSGENWLVRILDEEKEVESVSAEMCVTLEVAL